MSKTKSSFVDPATAEDYAVVQFQVLCGHCNEPTVLDNGHEYDTYLCEPCGLVWVNFDANNTFELAQRASRQYQKKLSGRAKV